MWTPRCRYFGIECSNFKLFFRFKVSQENPGLLAGRYPYKPLRDPKNIDHRTHFLSHSSSAPFPFSFFPKQEVFLLNNGEFPSNLQNTYIASRCVITWKISLLSRILLLNSDGTCHFLGSYQELSQSNIPTPQLGLVFSWRDDVPWSGAG